MDRTPTKNPSSLTAPWPWPGTATCGGFRIVYGASCPTIENEEGLLTLHLAVPGLSREEETYGVPGRWRQNGTDSWIAEGEWVRFGLLLGSGDRSLAEQTEHVYQQVLSELGDSRLYRCWHFVPRINEIENGLERYRAFCLERSRAYGRRYGHDASKTMAAASAVGCGGDRLAMLYLAGLETPQHWENPLQEPAYCYPEEYGPLPPSFCRATTLSREKERWVFVSGTSSIRGSCTVAAGDVVAQTRVTLENLDALAANIGAPRGFAAEEDRMLRVYLRRREDREPVETCLRDWGVEAGAMISWLEADICRADLDVEIELAAILR